jgi:uncharacterized cupin superfamily protein
VTIAKSITTFTEKRMIPSYAGSGNPRPARKETFTSGDSLFIPKGAKVTWHITETLKKYYLIAA